MAKGMPSMIALLGLLAVAGYKNKGKLSDMLANTKKDDHPGDLADDDNQAPESLLSRLGDMFGGSTAGANLSDGLNELIDRFKNAGQSEDADSWIERGINRELASDSLERALGEDTIAELRRKTGLSRDKLLNRLRAAIPEAVDRYSPEGRLPNRQEADQYR